MLLNLCCQKTSFLCNHIFLSMRNMRNEIKILKQKYFMKYFMFHEMLLKMYFMKCSERKLSQCILAVRQHASTTTQIKPQKFDGQFV